MGEGGSIINQARCSAMVGVPNFAAYWRAKGAVVALTRSMALDLAPRGIRVNVICPGTVYTPLMEPMLRARGDGDCRSAGEDTGQVPDRAGWVRPRRSRSGVVPREREASFLTGS